MITSKSCIVVGIVCLILGGFIGLNLTGKNGQVTQNISTDEYTSLLEKIQKLENDMLTQQSNFVPISPTNPVLFSEKGILQHDQIYFWFIELEEDAVINIDLKLEYYEPSGPYMFSPHTSYILLKWDSTKYTDFWENWKEAWTTPNMYADENWLETRFESYNPNTEFSITEKTYHKEHSLTKGNWVIIGNVFSRYLSIYDLIITQKE